MENKKSRQLTRQLSDRFTFEFTPYCMEEFLRDKMTVVKIMRDTGVRLPEGRNLPQILKKVVNDDFGGIKRAAAYNLDDDDIAVPDIPLAYLLIEKGRDKYMEVKTELENKYQGLMLHRTEDPEEELDDNPNFRDNLAQLIMGYADNMYSCGDGNKDGSVWNNILGRTLKLINHKDFRRKWTDVSQHYSEGKETWNGRMFLGSKVMTVPSIRVRDGGVMNVEAKTFVELDGETARKASEAKAPIGSPYTVNKFNRLIPVKGTGRKSKYWYNQGEKSVKSEIRFLDYSSVDAFEKCRMGILNSYLDYLSQRVGEKSSNPLIKIKPWEYERGAESRVDYAMRIDDVISHLKDRLGGRVRLEVLDDSTEDDDLKEALLQGIRNACLENRSAESKEVVSLLLCHNQDYYKKKGIEDVRKDYIKEHNSVIAQEITYETLRTAVNGKKENKIQDALRPIINMLIVSLGVKEDIARGRFNLPPSGGGLIHENMSFAIRTPLRRMKERTEAYAVMHVKAEGKISFDRILSGDECISEDNLKIYQAFCPLMPGKPDASIEAIAWKDINDIYTFRKTSEHTVPNNEEIDRALWIKKEVMNADRFWELFGEFEDVSISSGTSAEEEMEVYRNKIIARMESLQMNFDGENSYSLYQKSISDAPGKRSRLYKPFVEFLETKGISFDPHIRRKENEGKFGIENIKGVWYFSTPDYNAGTGINAHSVSYFAGVTDSVSIQNGIPKGIPYRTVSNMEDHPYDYSFVAELLRMCTVQFVKLGNNTVLPFPVKYLREYELMKEKEDGYCQNEQ